METISDFEELLKFLEKHRAEYLIIGGLAFIYHAKPRYTKDMDILIRTSDENIQRVNKALVDFGSPCIIEPGDKNEILQIGVAPHRVDIMPGIKGVTFDTAWGNRIRDKYGNITANWISFEDLVRAKSRLEGPRHRDDLQVLKSILKTKKRIK